MGKFLGPAVLCVCLGAALRSFALGPMYSSRDLVAGEGEAGLEDGPFYSALFNRPTGIAADPGGGRLYVADQGNHCLRVIDLAHGNRVSTLAGRGKAGFEDGPLDRAAFNEPTLLAALPRGRLIVWDRGNHCFRLADLARRTLSTLAGGKAGEEDGAGDKAGLGEVGSMAYLESQGALYFTQPDSGTLRRLDPEKGEVTTVIRGDVRLPHPRALCAADGKLYVADRDLPQGYQLSPDGNGGWDWKPFPCASGTLGLEWNDGSLYALQADGRNPLARVFPAPKPVLFYDSRGEPLGHPDRQALFQEAAAGRPLGWAADPRSPRRFFFTHPDLHIVTSLRDLDEAGLMGNESWSGGIMDFDYPAAKPPRVFRILMVGDSHLFHNDGDDGVSHSSNRMVLTAKRLESDLNLLAALQDGPFRFEVLTLAHVSTFPINLWPYYEAPPIVRKYRIDTVLYLAAPSGGNLEMYFQRPPGAGAIPAQDIDVEYMTGPDRAKAGDGKLRDFVGLCLSRNCAREDANGHIHFSDLGVLNRDPALRAKAAELYARPLRALRKNLAGLVDRQGDFPPWITCLVPPPRLQSYRPVKSFWEAVAGEIGGPVLDLSDEWSALRVSYYPVSELNGYDHYNTRGHELLAFLLAHELAAHRWVPWK